MTNKEILKNNKLIADFLPMEWSGHSYAFKEALEVSGDEVVAFPFYYPSDLKFHSSFDWLISVVEKIESLGYKVTIEGFCCVIYKQYGEPVAYCSNFDTKINATYHAVAAFVNWHNSIK